MYSTTLNVQTRWTRGPRPTRAQVDEALKTAVERLGEIGFSVDLPADGDRQPFASAHVAVTAVRSS